ncbi:two-partner secretion domain-containing protein [unidentified bacterial endosymbiont]|uniref:two-partner secretion domain-containing protein n=1 Tax=unidentified bacterial endosymbiont TaxID=2355 RepID=UPI0020A10E0A|nr:filamentous hemagglutinin N-terminal domain-containing protein [unidentified bacterial endosymbiont]
MNSKKNSTSRFEMKWHPVAAAVLLALPIVTQAADISMKNGVVGAANNVPVININTANDKGLSHNVYDKLNVDKNGLIFNNSATGANTTLGGNIQGNSNLASGTAKVILNEVTSKNTTAINGMMEIAGDKADLIIANPNGITVNGGGTINAGKLTLTTGTPDIQNGEVAGYSVKGGSITLGQLNTTSPTEILARNVVVNDKVTAGELNVVAGNNYVNSAGQVTGTVTATGSRNTNSIDVAALGGMYAKKINLVSTENGVGVRNLGLISAGVDGVNIDSKGQLLNSNARIETSGQINIKTNGALNNTTGAIASTGSIALDTNKNNLVNTRAGNISTSGDLYINSGAIDNTNGKLASAGTLAVDTNNATLTNSGKGTTVGIEAGIVALKTGTLNNRNGQIKGGYVGLESSVINNNSGLVDSLGNVDVVSAGNVDNTKGLLRSAGGYTKISAKGTLNNGTTKTADTSSNDSLGIIAEKGVQIAANSINNNGGQMASNGDISLESNGAIDNYAGKLNSSAKVIAKGSSLRNDNGGLSGKGGISVSTTGNITNYIGVFSSEEGDVALGANAVNNYGGFMMGQNIDINANAEVNNNTAMIVANKTLTVNAKNNIDNRNGNNFGSAFGLYFGMPQQTGGMIGKEGVSLTGNHIYNNTSRIIAENGPLTLQAKGNIDNTRALLVSGADTRLKSGGVFYNNYATTYAAGNLNIDSVSLENYSSGTLIDNNATGIIATDKDLVLNVNNNVNNYGWISSLGDATVNILKGVFYNRNTLAAEKSLTLSALNGVENFKDISAAGGDLTITTQRHVTNNSNSNMVGDNVTITAVNDINNRGNIVGQSDLIVKTNGNLNNNLTMRGEADVSISANSINNNNATLKANGDMTLATTANVSNNRGNITAVTGDLSLVSAKGNLDNTWGMLTSGANAIINAAGVFYNNYATTWSAGNLDITAGTLYNASNGSMANNTATGVIASDKNLTLNVDNSFTNYGWISSKDALNINVQKGVLYNRNTLSADNALAINALNGVENFQDIVAGTRLNIDTQKHVTNNTKSNILAQNIVINAVKDINNRGNIVGDYTLTAKTSGNLYNYLNMLSYGVAAVTANNVTNSGKDAVLGGLTGMELNANKVTNTGTVVGI